MRWTPRNVASLLAGPGRAGHCARLVMAPRASN